MKPFHFTTRLFPLLVFFSSLTQVLSQLSVPETIFSSCSSPSKCSRADSGKVEPTTHLLTFLERLQETALQTFGKSHFDPKLYVDLSLKSQLPHAETAFDKLLRASNGSVSAEDLRLFMAEYFEGAGDDMVYVKPVDFVPEPEGFLPQVKSKKVRAWALKVHSLWKNLSRKVSDEVLERPEFHTLLPLTHPVVIPGSRFREVYYWDSYWVIRFVLILFLHFNFNMFVVKDQFIQKVIIVLYFPTFSRITFKPN